MQRRKRRVLRARDWMQARAFNVADCVYYLYDASEDALPLTSRQAGMGLVREDA